MKILHTADIHIGYETYGRLDPQTGRNTRLLDFKRSFDFMVQRALKEDVDLFLFCGDAYRTADPTPTQQQLFAEALRPIADAGIPIAMIIGNHDHPVSFGKSSSIDIFSHLAGQVHIFRRPTLKTLETKAGPLQLLALPWPIRSLILSKDEHRKKAPAEIKTFIEGVYVDYIEQALPKLDPGLPTVLAGHFSVQGASLGGSERTNMIAYEPMFTVGQLARPPIDYVALGHIHKHQDCNAGQTPPVVYPSSIERINFREWADPKGFVLVDIDADGTERKVNFRFIKTPARTFVLLDVDVQEVEEPTDYLLRELHKQPLDDAIVRVRYRINEERLHEVDVRQIRQALASAHAIAGIDRVVEGTTRERRTSVSRDASIQDALKAYIAQQADLQPLETELLETATELEILYERRQKADAS